MRADERLSHYFIKLYGSSETNYFWQQSDNYIKCRLIGYLDKKLSFFFKFVKLMLEKTYFKNEK